MAHRVDGEHAQTALLFVKSSLKPSSPVTLDQYHQYYREELFPSILKLPIHNGPRTVMHYQNVSASPGERLAFAALLPVRELQLLYGPIRNRAIAMARGKPFKAFNGDTATQHIDYGDFSYRYLYALEGDEAHDIDQGRPDAYPLTMISDSLDAPDDPSSKLREEALFKAKHQLPWRFQVCEDYLRSVVYKLLMGEAPRYLILHYFVREHEYLSKDILTAGADECVDRQIYSLLHSQGEINYPPPASTMTEERTEPGFRRSSEHPVTSSESSSISSAAAWNSL